ncbi:MAG: RHS repeat-associated core domain-containing protein, partial [Bacteroidota bacterium]
ISDINGSPIQHLQYLPYGELFIEQRNTANYYTPYKFTAKELDQETGYSYFGARYYLPEWSIWGSVDPLSDDYPHQSPFMYCSGDPINRADPTGMNDGWVEDENKIYWDPKINSQKDLQDNYQHGRYLGNEVSLSDGENYKWGGNDGKLHDSKPLTETQVWADPNMAKMSANPYQATKQQKNMYGFSDNFPHWLLNTGMAVYGAMDAIEIGFAVRALLTKSAVSFAAKEGAATVEDLIKLNGGKNSVTIENATQKIRYDLAGKAHGGVATPHMQVYNKNFVNGVVKSVTRASKEAIPMMQKDLKIVTKFLKGQ